MTKEEKKEFELLQKQTAQNTKDIALLKANKGSRKQLRKARRLLGLLPKKK